MGRQKTAAVAAALRCARRGAATRRAIFFVTPSALHHSVFAIVLRLPSSLGWHSQLAATASSLGASPAQRSAASHGVALLPSATASTNTPKDDRENVCECHSEMIPLPNTHRKLYASIFDFVNPIEPKVMNKVMNQK